MRISRIAGTEEFTDQAANPPKPVKKPEKAPFWRNLGTDWKNLQANTMRKVESTQCELGGSFISEVVIGVKSRDDIPALLIGLQHLYNNTALRVRLCQLRLKIPKSYG